MRPEIKYPNTRHTTYIKFPTTIVVYKGTKLINLPRRPRSTYYKERVSFPQRYLECQELSAVRVRVVKISVTRHACHWVHIPVHWWRVRPRWARFDQI